MKIRINEKQKIGDVVQTLIKLGFEHSGRIDMWMAPFDWVGMIIVEGRTFSYYPFCEHIWRVHCEKETTLIDLIQMRSCLN